MKKFLALSLSVLLSNCARMTEHSGTNGSDIRNGADAPAGTERSVLALVDSRQSTVAPYYGLIGSASVIRYRRCLLTARHVIEGDPDGDPPSWPDTAVQGPDVRNWDDAAGRKRTQPFQSSLTRLPQENSPFSDVVDDIALVWLRNLRSTADRPRIRLEDQTPLEYRTAIGLDGIAWNAEGNSPGAPMTVNILGFGANATVEGRDVGSGILRTGLPEARRYIISSQQTTGFVSGNYGSYYEVFPVGGDNDRLSCKGDSGGPVLKDGRVFAVMSMQFSTERNCATGYSASATGLDDNSRPQYRSNASWLERNIERRCAIRTSFAPGCSGQVVGSISPPQRVNEDPDLNNVIHAGDVCLPDDGEELIHEGQTITVTATPDPGYEFVAWRGGALCPCDGWTTPICTFNYEQAGYYTEDESIDESSCLAVFRNADPSAQPVCCGDGGLCKGICRD